MATALQQQLAAIAANSTHQLDLKAQKGRHSKSLLFEPRDAAAQSFDTIYHLCYEAFEELCVLDARFVQFGRNLFSEQSKSEDRTQMTARENEALNETVDGFLALICGRLLLKPAMTTVEWLIRRFQVDEYNTESLLLTFLPYHTSHIFPTLLSILPHQLPPKFKFLHPYVASLQNPPRSAIVSAVSTNTAFFSTFNQHVLSVCKAKHHSNVLLGFWASTTAQAVNAIIDSSRSGRDSIRRQREEDLLLQALPVVQSALSIGIPELYLGACMVVAILATKASLQDKVLDALLEAVARAATKDTRNEGLACLAIVAEEKQNLSLPAPVLRLLNSDDTLFQLFELSKSQRVSKLAAGLTTSTLTQACKRRDAAQISLARNILFSPLLDKRYAFLTMETLVSNLAELREADPVGETTIAVSNLVSSLAEDPNQAQILEEAVRAAQIDTSSLQLPSATTNQSEPEPMHIDSAENVPENGAWQPQFDALIEALPELPSKPLSFLNPHHTDTFDGYAHAFNALEDRNKTRFLDLPQLHRTQYIKRPEFLTFLARVWTCDHCVATKCIALGAARKEIASNASDVLDTQPLLPYTLAALADASSKVRKEGALLCRELNQTGSDKRSRAIRVCPATDGIYGNDTGHHALASEDAHKFMSIALQPILEDCIVDEGYLVRAIADILNDGALGSETTAERKELKKTLRTDACTFFASHAVLTPAARVQMLLLNILSRVGKSASQARSKILAPFVKTWATNATHADNSSESGELDKLVIASLSHRSAEEIQLLKEIATGSNITRDELQPLAFARLGHLFPSMKNSASQVELVEFFFDLAIDDLDLALETLRTIQLPTDILVSLVDKVPSITDLQDLPPSAKRRRTSREDLPQPSNIDQNKLQAATRRLTLVLELVEGSQPEKHPSLLRGLFHTLSELHNYKTATGSDLVYVHQLLLGSLLSMVDGLRKTSDVANVDRSVIRTDLIVECVRTTSSTQIHNTAILLVSSLAAWAPELVLHNVMPLFTFMSSTLLRHSDEFSAHVTDQTVARIVPALAASLKRKGNLLSGASELLLSFTAAFEHIPLPRRAGLFRNLIETLGPSETLFAVVAMLIERYPNDVRVPAFVLDMVNHFPAITALHAAVQYVDLVFDCMKPKRGLSDVLLGLNDKDTSAIEDSVDSLLEGLATLLQSSAFRGRLETELKKANNSADEIRTIYASLLEKAMRLPQDLTSSVLKESANVVLLSVLGLLPTKDFIESSAQLMQSGSDQTRQQVFQSLESRVDESAQKDARTFLEVLPNCAVFIREDQPMLTRYAAISCIDKISERFGKIDREAVLAAAEHVSGNAALGSGRDLRIISMLCLASMTGVLEDEAISILPDVLDRTLRYLDEGKNADAIDTELLNAGFSILIAVAANLPWMLSGGVLDQALTLASETAEDQPEAAQAFCALLATKVNPSDLFASIDRVWSGDHGVAAAHNHLSVFHQAIGHHPKSTITKNTAVLFSILLKAFDLRRFHQDTEDVVFDLVNRIALDLVMKLNDTTFRPFFMRLVEWAENDLPKSSNGRTLRQASLYSFAAAFFEQLKSLVTSYTSFLLESAPACLQSQLADDESKMLLELVLQTLSASFRHDQDDFWQTPAHFDAIAAPLLDRLTMAKRITVTDHVIPTITDMATAASPEHHKTINATIMSHMRHQDAAVRLAAVKCERSITDRLGLEWLTLLPEMLPLISELQEDDDENVEREILRWVKQIEDLTGESLEGMLA